MDANVLFRTAQLQLISAQRLGRRSRRTGCSRKLARSCKATGEARESVYGGQRQSLDQLKQCPAQGTNLSSSALPIRTLRAIRAPIRTTEPTAAPATALPASVAVDITWPTAPAGRVVETAQTGSLDAPERAARRARARRPGRRRCAPGRPARPNPSAALSAARRRRGRFGLGVSQLTACWASAPQLVLRGRARPSTCPRGDRTWEMCAFLRQ